MRFAPTVCAREVTGVDVGRHLHASTALDTVERALVAVTIVLQFLFGPVTNLDATMLADEMISLLGELGRNLRFNLRNRALHVGNLRQHIPQRGSVGWWPDLCR